MLRELGVIERPTAAHEVLVADIYKAMISARSGVTANKRRSTCRATLAHQRQHHPGPATGAAVASLDSDLRSHFNEQPCSCSLIISVESLSTRCLNAARASDVALRAAEC